MRSKNTKKRSAFRRGEKLALFFKKGVIVLLIFIFIGVVVLVVKLSAQTFRIRDILVSGNYHLDKEDIIDSINIMEGKNLLKLHFKDIDERLKHNTWVQKVSLRKQFPDMLMVKIEEAVPKALLSFRNHMFLIDEKGNILEEIKGKSTPFLPVIKNINPEKQRYALSEGLKLIETLNEKNILSNKESVEIGVMSYGLAVKMDGELIKVGYGRYSEKLERWKELEPEIRKRGVIIKYVDLRFKDVIVKPVKIVKKESSL